MKKPMYENVQILLREAYCLLKGNATPELKNRFYKFIQHYIFPEGSDPDWNKVMLVSYVVYYGKLAQVYSRCPCENPLDGKGLC